MNDIKLLPPLLSGTELVDRISYYPSYDKTIVQADRCKRLERLSDIYKIFYPFSMTVMIYSKLYMATERSLKKKSSILAVKQRNDNYKAIVGDQLYHGIIGGADSLTIIGTSGIGKTSAIQTSLKLISDDRILQCDKPFMKIIPALQVQCPFDASPKGLLLEILRSVDEVIDTKYYERSRKASDTTDILIGTVSQVALNHLGLLVIDEIQNVYGRKSGTSLMSMIIQLINSSGISICMVGTEECLPFFESSMQLSRRSQGLRYGILPYDSYFEDFCKKVWTYQYLNNFEPISAGVIEWLYEHSGGIVANVISLIHDAQEIAILDGYEKLDLVSLNSAYKNRMTFMHKYIEVPHKQDHSNVRKHNQVFEEKVLEEYRSIIEMVEAAKNKNVDILEYLIAYIHIEEVAIDL